MRTSALTYGLIIIVAATTTGCAAEGSPTKMASGEAVQLLTAREAVDRAFEYRQRAAVLRDQAKRLELEGRMPMAQAFAVLVALRGRSSRSSRSRWGVMKINDNRNSSEPDSLPLWVAPRLRTALPLRWTGLSIGRAPSHWGQVRS